MDWPIEGGRQVGAKRFDIPGRTGISVGARANLNACRTDIPRVPASADRTVSLSPSFDHCRWWPDDLSSRPEDPERKGFRYTEKRSNSCVKLYRFLTLRFSIPPMVVAMTCNNAWPQNGTGAR
jgi:hypothetical protein